MKNLTPALRQRMNEATPLRPAATLAEVQQRAALVERMRRARQEIAQQFIDCASWNDNARRTDEAPIDPDPDGDLQFIADYYDRLLRLDTQ